MTEWRIHIVPKLQPPDRTFVLFPSEDRNNYVVVDWYGKDMAAAKWRLQLVSGDPIHPPSAPPRDSIFKLVHEKTAKVLVFSTATKKEKPPLGMADIFSREVPDYRPMELRPASALPSEDAALIRFDPLSPPYLAINNKDRNRVLDLNHPDSQVHSGTVVTGWGWRGGDNQQWKLEFVT